MTLITNEHGELYHAEDFDGPRFMRLNVDMRRLREGMREPVIEERTCKWCGMPYEPRHVNQRYCCGDCRLKAKRKRYMESVKRGRQ